MASATVVTKLIIVNIIRTVAIATTSADHFHFAESDSMTVVTGNTDVSAAQFEVSLQIVVENPQIPCDRVVAGVATSSEVAAMWIII
jgi:hypothetical protein